MDHFEQKLASMTPRILLHPEKKHKTPLRLLGALAASFLLGVCVTYFAMRPEKPLPLQVENDYITTMIILDDESLRKLRCPTDISKLVVRQTRKQPVDAPLSILSLSRNINLAN